MNKVVLDKISNLKETVSSLYEETTRDVNTSATNTYNTLNTVLSGVTTVKNKISVLSDMFTDLRVLNGSAKSLVSLSSLPIIENKGIKIINDKITLDTLVKTNKEISIKDSSIASVENYLLLTNDNKKTNIDNFLKSSIDTKVSFKNTRYTFTLNLRYTSLEQLNSIELQLGMFTESYPIINSIKYIDKDSIEQKVVILNTNTLNYDLDYNREVDNKYVLDITPITTNQLMIEFTSKTTSSIIFKDVKTYFKTEVNKGELILGPIHTQKPLLKLALDCEALTTGCTFELSTDLDYWLSLDSSSIITNDTSTKILSFNTVNSKSIKTDEDIYTFYIKIGIESSVLSNEDLDINIYKTVREDNTINNDTLMLVEDNLYSAYKLKSSDFIHGSYHYVENLNIKDMNLENIEYLEINGVTKVRGLVDTKYSITDSNNNNTGSVGAELKVKRLGSEGIIESTQYDVANSKIYDIYPREISNTINTREKDNLCFMLKRTFNKTKIEIPPEDPVIPETPVEPPLATIMCEGAISQVVLKSDPTNYGSPATFNVYVNGSKVGSNISMFILNQGWSYDPVLKENSQRLNYSVWGDSSGFDYFYNSSGKHLRISIVPSNEAAKNIISISSLNENTTATLLENGGVSFCLAPQPSKDYLTYGGWFGEGWLGMHKYKIEVNGVQYEDDRTYSSSLGISYIGAPENVISRNAPNLDFLSAWISSGGGGTLALTTPGTYDIKLIPQASTNQQYWDEFMRDNSIDTTWGKPSQESGTPVTIDPVTGVWSFTLYKA